MFGSVSRRRCRALLLGSIACLTGACTSGATRRALDPPITTVAADETRAAPPQLPPPLTTTPPPPTLLPTTVSVTSTTTPPTTVPPTTTTVPPTTPPTTLPTLAPDQQPATADEGRALLATVPTAELPPDLAGLPAAMSDALQRVVDGGRPDEAFFDDVGSFAPAGVAVSPYLICPLSGNQQCAASPADFARFVSECGGAGTYLFSTMVERPDGWAAAGTCVWAPTPDEIEFVTQAAANLLLDELQRRGQRARRDPTLDGYVAAMAESAASQPELGSANDLDEFFANRDAISAYAQSRGEGYGYYHVASVSPAALADGGYLQSKVAEFVDAGSLDAETTVGIGSFFARGQLLTYYAIVT